MLPKIQFSARNYQVHHQINFTQLQSKSMIITNVYWWTYKKHLEKQIVVLPEAIALVKLPGGERDLQFLEKSNICTSKPARAMDYDLLRY